jgi:hypothetical protein
VMIGTKMFVSMRRIFYMQHLTTIFQRLWRQNQAQRYPSSKNRVFHVYDSPTLAWLAMLVFAIGNLMSDQLLVQYRLHLNSGKLSNSVL